MKSLVLALFLLLVAGTAYSQVIDGGGGSGDLTIGSAPVKNCSVNGYVLYNNNNVLGCKAESGALTPIGAYSLLANGTSGSAVPTGFAATSGFFTAAAIAPNSAGGFVTYPIYGVSNLQTAGSAYTVLTGDNGGLISILPSGAFTVTLPQAGTTGFPQGWNAGIANVLSTGGTTVSVGTGGFNGQTSWTLNQFDMISAISSGGSTYGYTGSIICGSMANNVPATSIFVGSGAYSCPPPLATGTGFLTAAAVNVGSAGSVVVNGGSLGTPSSGTLTYATGLPISTGVSGLGTGVPTALAGNTVATAIPPQINTITFCNAASGCTYNSCTGTACPYTPTAGVKRLRVWLMGGGGGGGSGGSSVTGTSCSGGGGGGASAVVVCDVVPTTGSGGYPAGQLYVVVDGGGAGAAGVGGAAPHSGSIGTPGGSTFLWDNSSVYVCRAFGGGAGGGGGSNANSGGGGGGGTSAVGGNGSTTGGGGGQISGTNGGAAAVGVGQTTQSLFGFGGTGGGGGGAAGTSFVGGTSYGGSTGGGSGGGVNSSNTAASASSGGTLNLYSGQTVGGTAGGSAGGVGGGGNTVTFAAPLSFGTGGGGSGGATSGTINAGGNGGVGAGGGGGGCSGNSANLTTGAGGSGGVGQATISEYF